ncbi:MAG TPA: hypothetical protein VN752_12055 [Solirubrobacterales bacterium]|nr:hypothetical protein [Solirubrobacterales bacterium]
MLDNSGEGPRLTATGAGDPTVTLFFPPQSIAEEKYRTADDSALRAARLAGPSQVAFILPAGTEIPLHVEGVLEALDMAEVIPTGEDMPTAIELPWRLPITPLAPSGAGVVADHEARPVTSESGTTGLWHTRLSAWDSGEADAGLVLLPLAPNPDDEMLDLQPLSGDHRQIIFAIADSADPSTLAKASRLELSALGGSLSSRLQTPSFAWDHDTMLGRDQKVGITLRGICFPTNHEWVYTETAERRFGPGEASTGAGIHREVTLSITKPIVSTADGDPATVRRFPFREVEIMQRSFSEIDPAQFVDIYRTPRPPDDLSAERDAALSRMEELDPLFREGFDLLPKELPAYIDAVRVSSGLAEAEEQAGRSAAGMEALRTKKYEEINALRSSIPVDPPPPPPDFSGEGSPPEPPPAQNEHEDIDLAIRGLELEINRDLNDEAIRQVRENEARWQETLARIQADVVNDFNRKSTFEGYVASLGTPEAEEYGVLSVKAEKLHQRIQQITEAQKVPIPAYWMPLAGGQPMRFPLRLAGDADDAFESMPLVLVRDEELPEKDHFDPLSLVSDPEVKEKVRALWESVTDNGTLSLPGTRIDLIRSGEESPPPGDVHEVHELRMVGVSVEGGYRPQLDDFTVELPALRQLLPERPSRVKLRYAETFLEGSGIPEIPLEIAEQLDVDFRQSADRSGGLVSPKFIADGISRKLGPVAAGALPPAMAGLPEGQLPHFDPKAIFAEATLLGLPLSSLIKLPADPMGAGAKALPLPPEIVQLVEGGIPSGVTMSWKLDLEKHGPFVPTGATKLELSVKRSQAEEETKGKVNDFQLVLPPGEGDHLLTLSFKSLTFIQSKGRAPDLKVEGMSVEFGGALELLQELAAELKKVIELPEATRVDVTPSGLEASYAISAPRVPAGAFLLTNVAMRTGVVVPFDGKPVTVSLAFATRENPFNVNVLTFGGGGYIDLTIGPQGLMRLEAAIEFGAHMEVDFIVARGEVHAMGGVRFTQSGDSFQIDGFIDIGGSVEVLGLVSVAISLLIELSYKNGNRLEGSATLVLELDLTLFSESVEISSGTWTLAGSERASGDRELGGGEPDSEQRDPLEDWKLYRGAFATA